MTKLSGDKPEPLRDFHGARGEHLYSHPETYEPRRSAWTHWERRYAAHLDRHKELATNPEPMDSDHKAVVSLFRHIELLESIIAKEKLLIIAVREKLAAGGDVDEKSFPWTNGTPDEREM